MPRDDTIKEVQAWLTKAQNDLKAAEIPLRTDDAPCDVVCFHAQQAAEKQLKAALTCLGVQFPKTHDLAVLVGLFPADSPVRNQLIGLSELTDAAVSVRYPGYLEEYDRETAESLVEQALSVRAAVVRELTRLGCPVEERDT
jgi:HEPN domain-containing protein